MSSPVIDPTLGSVGESRMKPESSSVATLPYWSSELTVTRYGTPGDSVSGRPLRTRCRVKPARTL